jgi:hypothetical protein
MKNHTDMKMKEVISTAKERAFENSTLRQLSQFERVQMKTALSDDEMNSETALAVHRVDSVSGRRRRDRERDRKRERERERERREREQAVSE